MKIYSYPKQADWETLAKRNLIEKVSITTRVENILNEVKNKKDVALFDLTKKLDGVVLKELQVSEKELQTSVSKVPTELQEAIQLAKQNIETFHRAQLKDETPIETSKGVLCWRKNSPIDRVGVYIPGGSAPLFSSVLMLGIPAKLAGCPEIILCTPPDKNGEINPAILYSAQLIGITKVYKIGGAQAIAAMAFGTETIPQVYKIFGPGNQYVTKAKELVQQEGISIDMPAGPSEVLIIADQSGIPEFIAADLLSQAEHGADSQVILLSTSEKVIQSTLQKLSVQLEQLPRKTIAEQALENSKAILFETENECVEFSNLYAPEHLIIASENPELFASQITNAGSVFLGNYSCESAGDYASGTNHTLPTNGFAKNFSGVSIDSFVKKITFQKLSKTGLSNIGKAIELMAEAEGLFAHKNAVSIRLKTTDNV